MNMNKKDKNEKSKEEQKEEQKNEQKVFEFNTPHSWSNLVGYGNIHINTSDKKKYSTEWNRLFKME